MHKSWIVQTENYDSIHSVKFNILFSLNRWEICQSATISLRNEHVAKLPGIRFNEGDDWEGGGTLNWFFRYSNSLKIEDFPHQIACQKL